MRNNSRHSGQFRTIGDDLGRFRIIQIDSEQFGTIQNDSGPFGTIRYNSGQFGTIRDHSGPFLDRLLLLHRIIDFYELRCLCFTVVLSRTIFVLQSAHLQAGAGITLLANILLSLFFSTLDVDRRCPTAPGSVLCWTPVGLHIRQIFNNLHCLLLLCLQTKLN